MTQYDLPATMPWSNTIANFRTVVPSPRSCFIVGATGEVGKRLVHHVLSASAFDRVLVIGRRPIGYEGPNVNILVSRRRRHHHQRHRAARLMQGHGPARKSELLPTLASWSPPATSTFWMAASLDFVPWAPPEPRRVRR